MKKAWSDRQAYKSLVLINKMVGILKFKLMHSEVQKLSCTPKPGLLKKV